MSPGQEANSHGSRSEEGFHLLTHRLDFEIRRAGEELGRGVQEWLLASPAQKDKGSERKKGGREERERRQAGKEKEFWTSFLSFIFH